jgi:hypothetical protein
MISIEKAMEILGEAPTYILRNDDFDEACGMAVKALAEQNRREAGPSRED